MKTFSKITLLVLSVIILFSFAACSAKQNNESENETETFNNTVVTKENTTPSTTDKIIDEITSSFDKNNYSPKISKSTAKEKSKKALEQYIKNELNSENGTINIDKFEFYSMELKMPDEPSGFYETDSYGNPVKKEFKNPYWYVQYKYTPELCDFAYFLIDAETGELIFSGYMGD